MQSAVHQLVKAIENVKPFKENITIKTNDYYILVIRKTNNQKTEAEQPLEIPIAVNQFVKAIENEKTFKENVIIKSNDFTIMVDKIKIENPKQLEKVEEEENELEENVKIGIYGKDFLIWFKANFVDRCKRLRLKKFLQYLKHFNVIEQTMKPKELKELLVENEMVFIKNGTDHHVSDKEINEIYAGFFSYVKGLNKSEYGNFKEYGLEEN